MLGPLINPANAGAQLTATIGTFLIYGTMIAMAVKDRNWLAMALASVLPPWVAAVVFLLLLAAAALGFLAADAVRDEVERQDAKLKSDVAVMRALQSQAASLAAQCDDPEARAALAEISEQFRYSDPVSSPATAEAETELGAVLEELQASLLDRDTVAVAPLTAKLQALLTERNRLCRLNK